jgi:uncharacterized protein with PQ loop repeat
MIQIIYFISSSIGIVAMIPQVWRLIQTKQSDGLSLTTWGTWACCQMVSLAYAISINARAYVLVNIVWITFYWTMVFLIIKYRKRRSLLETLIYWYKRGREEKKHSLSFKAKDILSPLETPEKL